MLFDILPSIRLLFYYFLEHIFVHKIGFIMKLTKVLMRDRASCRQAVKPMPCRKPMSDGIDGTISCVPINIPIYHPPKYDIVIKNDSKLEQRKLLN